MSGGWSGASGQIINPLAGLFKKPTPQSVAYSSLPPIPDEYINYKKANPITSLEFFEIKKIFENLQLNGNYLSFSDLIKLYENLPKTTKIYRGGTAGTRGEDWTLNYELAMDFVNRSHGFNSRKDPVLQVIKVQDLLDANDSPRSKLRGIM